MPEASDLRAYLDELWRRLPAFADRAAGVPADERGSLEWLAAAGHFWQCAREDAGLSPHAAASTLSCSVNQLRLMEHGMIEPGSFGRQRLRKYAEALSGDSRLYDRFRDHFER